MGRKVRALWRFTALLLFVSLVLGLVGPVAVSYQALAASDEEASVPVITYGGEVVSTVTLPQQGKIPLKVEMEGEGNFGYHWQIRVPDRDYWVDISLANSDTAWVTYALIGSMLEPDGSAQLRCRLVGEEEELVTDPVKVVLSYTLPLPDAEEEKEEILSSPTKLRMTRNAAAREVNPDDYTTHSIVINYLFDNNALAFEPYGATVAHGSSFHEVIESPEVVGYAPFRRVGENYVDATFVELSLTNITEDIVINVVYEPTLVEFQIHHHLQNLYDDEYSLNYDYITYSKAITGTTVGEGLAKTEEELPGFRALAYEKLTVAADGSTVVEIRYDRNYYLIDFDMNGGYGTEPVYTRFGTPVGANNPTRHGYVFDGWELVSYNGEAPSAEQASQYAISATNTIDVPAANLRYRARWITQRTTYTMVFWKENADNNRYSYWGYLDGLTALSGSTVSAQDWADRCTTIDDSEYFTFNAPRSDKDVLVEGDGSTVVNVYYTRNYYTLTFKGSNTKCTIKTGHVHGDDCYDIICGREEHIHGQDCVGKLVCSTEEHTAHDESCAVCGKVTHVHGGTGCECNITAHTHDVSCWGSGVGDRATPTGTPRNPKNGQVYRTGTGIRRVYYIYLFGSWYKYTPTGSVSNNDIVDSSCRMTEHVHGENCSCDLPEHEHEDGCYRDVLHTHTSSCYEYSCGQVENQHKDECYRLTCAIAENHSHTTSCNNTIKVVRRKYQEDISDLWPVVDDNGKEYNSGERWSPSGSTYYSQVLVYLAKMTPDDFTLTLSTSSADTFVMHYYLQVLPGDTEYDETVDGKRYKLSHIVRANYNYVTYDEDFVEITGFDRASSSPKFSGDQLDINGGGNVYFYYDRGTDNPLTFNNNGIILNDKTVAKVMYGASLKEYNFTPEYPDNLEPGAYTFKGWYTSPGCFDGTEVDWDTLVMEDGGLQLYAKWAPITHRVRVFKDASLTEQIGGDQIVDHKSFAHAPEGNVVNGNYVFQGWFYKDSSDGKEKAFVFTGIPITESMDIYAKWSSHISVDYRIEYRLKLTGEMIADPTEGSAIAGHNKTFDAKAGTELYPEYQVGFYPLVNSHTITMSADGNHVFIFEYVYVESVPYKVRYVDAITGLDLAPEKLVPDNTLSVVTETFVRVDGKMSDAYQKRLVLVAEGSNPDENGIAEENVITFYYNTDQAHAYYRVVHYIQNISGNEYREYRSQETVGDIGTIYTIPALTMTGFRFDGSLTRINGVLSPVSGNSVSAELGESGLLIELYYPRDTVSYVVRYLDSVTREEIYPAKDGSGVFGEQISETAPVLSHLGYTLVGDSVRLLTLSANTDYNVLEFTYQESIVSLKYQLVGPAGGAALSQTSQNVKAISGVPDGSYPMLSEGFIFQGWYLDAACTRPVPAEWVNEATMRLIPQKTADVWKDTTYYAKVVALETDLTISVTGCDDRDEKQSFLFRIVGERGTDTEGIDLTVSVLGDGEVTVTCLPTGNYTVTELISWSWRYDTENAVRTLTLDYSPEGTRITYENQRDKGMWLDGNDSVTNLFK